MEQTNINIWIIDSCATEATKIENDILSSYSFANIQKFNNYTSAFETLCNRERKHHPKVVFLACSTNDNLSLLEFLNLTSTHYLSFFFDAHIIMKEFNEDCLEKAFQNRMTKGWFTKSAQPTQIKQIFNNFNAPVLA